MTEETSYDQVQRAIIQAVDKLYRLYGYKKTSVEDIARETRLSRSTIYLHFHSKEDIALSWAEQFNDRIFLEMNRIAEKHQPPSIRLRELLHARILFRLDAVQPFHKSVDDILEAIHQSLAGLKARYQARESLIFAGVLQQGKECGEFDFADARETAVLLLLATNALLPSNLDPELFLQREEVRSKIIALTDLLMDGLRNDKG